MYFQKKKKDAHLLCHQALGQDTSFYIPRGSVPLIMNGIPRRMTGCTHVPRLLEARLQTVVGANHNDKVGVLVGEGLERSFEGEWSVSRCSPLEVRWVVSSPITCRASLLAPPGFVQAGATLLPPPPPPPPPPLPPRGHCEMSDSTSRLRGVGLVATLWYPNPPLIWASSLLTREHSTTASTPPGQVYPGISLSILSFAVYSQKFVFSEKVLNICVLFECILTTIYVYLSFPTINKKCH